MKMRLGEVEAEIEYAEDQELFHGIVRAGPGLARGDLVELYGASVQDLREECRKSLEAHRESRERFGLPPVS